MAQDSVGEAAPRDAGEVFLDGLEGGGQVCGVAGVGCRAGVDGDREQGGEPADGPGQFRFEAGAVRDEAGFAAVALQFDVGEGLVLAEVAAPAGERDGERGQQHVVDARVERGRDAAEQGGRDVGADRHGRRPLPCDGVGRVERAPAQWCVGPGQGAPEVGAVVVERGAFQQLGPAAERGAHRRQSDRCAGGVLPPGGGEVLHQDPPGHAVDHHVVGDEDEPAGVAAPHGAQHDAVRRVQRLRGERDALVERPVALLPSDGGTVPGRRDVEAPAAVADEPGAEHVVAFDDGGEDRVEGDGGQVRRGVQHHGLHESVDRVGGLAEPAHDR